MATAIGEECGLAMEVIIAILTALGGDPYSTAEYVQEIPYDLVMRTAQNLPNGIAELTPMNIGKVARWHHRSTEVWIRAKQPANPPARGEAPGAGSRTIRVIQVIQPPPPPAKRKVRNVIEQGDTSDTVTLLDDDALLKMRYVYYKKMGDPPPRSCPPYRRAALRSQTEIGLEPAAICRVCGIWTLRRTLGQAVQIHRPGVVGGTLVS